MNLEIVAATAENINHVNRSNHPFQINQRARVQLENGTFSFRVEAMAERTKQFLGEDNPNTYLDNPERAIFLAYAKGELAGEVLLMRWWNQMAWVENLAVMPRFRRQGVATRLLDQAVVWARQQGLAGLMLETQDTDVAACYLYQHYGCQLGGFDHCLYRGTDAAADEAALFWYYLF